MSGNGDAVIRVVAGAHVDRSQFSAFLDEACGLARSRFIMEHGDWLYRGPGGRFVAMVDEQVAGYRGIIPAVCVLGGEELNAAWGVGLYVRPSFRGRGLQKLLDKRLLEAANVRMSFPGELGATIYAKQGYSIREDLREWHLPVSGGTYWKGKTGVTASARRIAAAAYWGTFYTWAGYYRPKRTEILDSPDLKVLEDIFRRSVTLDLATSFRDTKFLQWRYLDAPYSSELTYYLTLLNGRPTHYAIVRYGASPGVPARVLDLFGDFQDDGGLTDLFRTIVRDASHRRASYTAILVSSPQLARTIRGPWRRAVAQLWRFRWLADDPQVQARFSTAQPLWTLGDSDLDIY